MRGSLSREAAGERLGVHPNTLQKYEANKRVPDASFVVTFCNAFAVSEHWLLQGDDADPATDDRSFVSASDVSRVFLPAKVETQDMGLVAVPFFEARAGAGAVQIAWDEKPAKRVFLPIDIFMAQDIRPNSAALMLAAGSSMEPTLSHDDLLLIDLADQSRSDGVFVVGRDGGVLVKRLQWRSTGALVLISDNKAYEPEILPRDEADDLRLIGRVRMVFKAI